MGFGIKLAFSLYLIQEAELYTADETVIERHTRTNKN